MSSPVPMSIASLTAFDQEENRQNWYTLLKSVSLIHIPLSGICVLIWIVLLFVTKQDHYIQFTLATSAVTVGGAASSLLLKFGKDRWLYPATVLVLGSLLVLTFWGSLIAGISCGLLGLFLWTLILGSLLGLPRRAMQTLAGIILIMTTVLICLEAFDIVKPLYDLARELPIALLMIWLVILTVIIIGLNVFKMRLIKVMYDRAQNSRRMEQFNEQLINASAAGNDLSVRVNSMSMELRATSQQQANGAAEQSSSVLAITTSLEEMGQSSEQIAGNARQVYNEAARALEIAREVKQVSEEASEAARRGQDSVEASIGSFEQVRIRIETVAQRLLALTESSKQIGAVIEIISGIADETHLLALNATIESAGAGQNGLRFGVIAGEVKNLADRVIESTQEVKKIIAELQGAVAAAVLAAEESKKETNQAVHKSYESGMVIGEVSQVITETAERGNAIAEYVESFSRLSEEITLAMQMQQNVNGQLIGSVQSIRTVAQESAAGSRQVAESAQKLSEMINQLKDVLDISEIEEKMAV